MVPFLYDLAWKIPVLLMALSLGEWLIHKYILHGRWLHQHGPRWLRFSYRQHHTEHHVHKRNQYLPHIALTWVDYWPFWLLALWHVQRYLLLGQPGGLSSLVAILIVTTGHRLLWNALHKEMHGLTTGSWVVRLPGWAFLARHHRGHHNNHTKNLNVVLPMADYLLGTVYTWPKQPR